MSTKKPTILLIGAGSFGLKHLAALRFLEKEGLLRLAGVVVQSEASQKRIAEEYGVPVYKGFGPELLLGIDAVDIVTPVETHLQLIRECIPTAHVFVEKPLAANTKETAQLKKIASRSAHRLMVGHIYRYHAVTIEVKKILRNVKERPLLVECSFLNPAADDRGRDVELEMLHPFDVIDDLFGTTLISKHVLGTGRTKTVSLRYTKGLNAVLKLGWSGEKRQRSLRLVFKKKVVVCDFDESSIIIYKDGSIKKRINLKNALTPLEAELRAFLKTIRTADHKVPNAVEGHAIVAIATMNRSSDAKKDPNKKKKVAIIGAGLFGTNCAIELGAHADVTVFERNDDILTEASYINQYRHHWGYHYPRSQETINEIRSSIVAFENRYDEAIIRDFPTYYSVAKKGSKVTAKEFLAFCNRNELPYTLEHPGEHVHNADKINLSLKTFEPIYDYAELKRITSDLLRKSPVKIRFGSEIVGAKIGKDGSKTLTIREAGKKREEHFDFVVNATYARYNNFTSWLGFPRKPIRLDVVEALWIKLDIPKVSFAIMDGPFTNMVPTSKDGIFTLVHIRDSIHERFVPKDGLVPSGILKSRRRSRAKLIIEESMKWFPVLKDAKILSSHYVLRGVNAYREHDDARTSDITEHGFGCYSILGGKIIQCVSTAEEVAGLIKS